MSETRKIHGQIKTLLGYAENISDVEFLKKWKRRSTQVCKPCWELKYCPYGPFVEQSPLMPSTRSNAQSHINYIKECLKTGQVGTIRSLDEKTKDTYSYIIEHAKNDPTRLAKIVAQRLSIQKQFAQAVELGEDPMQVLAPPMSGFEKYNVPFPLDAGVPEDDTFEITPEIKTAVENEIDRLEKAIESGTEDNRAPLEEFRRKMFEDEVKSFRPEAHPDFIPEEVMQMECTIFGHICPVVFVGESITETTENRRKGRYIQNHVKMRIVRRDNYTCQICSKHLLDDEVEFDHIIPLSKGGSSEENNIRLTCFSCNRDKSDRVEI